MICKPILLMKFLNESDPFFCTQLNGFMYGYASLTSQSNIRHYTQLNDQTVQFLKFQLNMSHLFVLSCNVKQFYLTQREDPIRCYHSESEWTWKQWQWKGSPHSSKIEEWSFTIRCFNVISRTPVGGHLSPLQRQSWCMLLPQPTGHKKKGDPVYE